MRSILQLSVAVLIIASGLPVAHAQVGIRWSSDLQAAQQAAQRDGRLLLIHFYTDWCGPCRRLEQEVFPRDDVARTIASNYIPVKINADRAKDAAAFYQVDRYPTDVIADAGGQVLLRTVTPQDPAQYIQLLNSVASQSRQLTPGYQAAYDPGMGGQATPPATQGAHTWGGSFRSQSPQDWQTGWGQNASGSTAGTQNPYYRPADIYQGQNGLQGDPAYASQYPGQPAPYGPHYADQFSGGQGPYPDLNPPRGDGFQANPYAGTDQNAGLPVQEMARQPWAQTNPYAANDGRTGPPTQDAGGFRAATQPNPAAPDLPVGLDGYCPVTLADQEEWHPGDPQWGVMHRGRTYRFASYDAMQKFRSDPDRYSPVMSGFDVVRYVDSAEIGVGKRRHGMWFHGKMYLFSDEASLDRFSRSPVYYEQRAYEIMVNGRR